MIPEPSFTVGIEEEYLLVDGDTGDLVAEAPDQMLPECQRQLADQVTPEFLQCQIEVGTKVADSLSGTRGDLAHLRRTVSGVAQTHGLAIIAASTHPWAVWRSQRQTDKERYRNMAESMQAVARRMTICGMHVHVAVEHEALRIDLMGQVSYILPHLLALSTSSPFLEGADTGLKSFRMAVYNELPRTGLPEQFNGEADYQRQVEILIRAGIIEDASKIWWDVRPSARFPTLELRIPDVCTRLDDAICIAALYRCWLRMLYRLRVDNQSWRRYSNFLISQNRWLAMRYGFEQGLIDFGQGRIVPYRQLLDDIMRLIRPDAEFFGCGADVEHAWDILERGTSADWQRETYQQAKANGASEEEALKAVVRWIQTETVAGL